MDIINGKNNSLFRLGHVQRLPEDITVVSSRGISQPFLPELRAKNAMGNWPSATEKWPWNFYTNQSIPA